MREIEEREYQQRVIRQTVESFMDHDLKSILIESPTGSGKTVMALSSLKRMQDRDPKLTFGWVAMRKKLLAQAAKENERIGVKNIEYISMFEKDPPKCKVMITDEAQHDAAQTCATLHKSLGAKWSLGLTATPFRTDRIKLSYEKIIRDCGVRFLIEQGYLSEFDQYAIPKWTPGHIAKHYLGDPERWGKSVIYLKNKELCWELEKSLKDGGIKTEVMLGSDSISKRDRTFEGFETGEIQVLINVYLLTEGFDAPDLKTAWVRDSGKLCTMQMSGRCLRKDPDNDQKVAQVVQSEQTTYPYTRVSKARKQYIWAEDGNEWRCLEPGVKVERILEMIQKNVLTKPIVLPSFITNGGRSIKSISVDSNGNIKTTTTRAPRPNPNFMSEDDLPPADLTPSE